MTRAWQNFRRHEAGVNFRGRGRRQERLFLSDGLDFRGFLRSSAFFPPPHPPPATIKLRRVYGEIEVFLSFLLPCEIADSNSLIAPLRWRSMILPSPLLFEGLWRSAWFESCTRFTRASTIVWMNFSPPPSRNYGRRRIRSVRKQAKRASFPSSALLIPPAYPSIDSLLHGFRLSLGEFAKFGSVWRFIHSWV